MPKVDTKNPRLRSWVSSPAWRRRLSDSRAVLREALIAEMNNDVDRVRQILDLRSAGRSLGWASPGTIPGSRAPLDTPRAARRPPAVQEVDIAARTPEPI